jgi:hypothetical protein
VWLCICRCCRPSSSCQQPRPQGFLQLLHNLLLLLHQCRLDLAVQAVRQAQLLHLLSLQLRLDEDCTECLVGHSLSH